MESIKPDQEKEHETCLDCLENTSIALNDLNEKELLSTAMSSYFLLYR